MSANLRIQWLHRKISDMSYPNAKRIAERFGISHRQAQRDVDFLRLKLGAPLAYSYDHKGFYYKSDFTLPIAWTSDNDEDYTGIVSASPEPDADIQQAENTVVQMQIPYSAEIRVADRLTAVELGGYIAEKLGDNIYRCEFHSIEKFISMIMSIESDIVILKPEWLRARIIRAAERIIKNNKDSL